MPDRDSFLDRVAEEVIRPLGKEDAAIQVPGSHYRTIVTREPRTYLSVDALRGAKDGHGRLLRVHVYRDDRTRFPSWGPLAGEGPVVAKAGAVLRFGKTNDQRTYLGWQWPVVGPFEPHLAQVLACAEWLHDHALPEEARVKRPVRWTPAETAAVEASVAALATDALEETEARRGDQGFVSSAERRRVIERRAMDVVEAWLRSWEGWTYEDTSAREPFDFLATRGAQRRFIEVKGTTGAGDQVIITSNEHRHAVDHAADSVLVVVHAIEVHGEPGQMVATGGERRVFAPWRVEEGTLEPIAFRHEPKGG